jgi:hypothetical protein
MAYIPSTGRSGAPCKLIVALHGCATDTTFTGDLFPKYSYLDNFRRLPADTGQRRAAEPVWLLGLVGLQRRRHRPEVGAADAGDLNMVAALGGVLPASAALRFRVGVHTPGHAAPPTRPLQRPWAGP